jgi:hypothetical protein
MKLSELIACTLTRTDLKTQRERWLNLGDNFGVRREETEDGLRLFFTDHPAVERDHGALVMAVRSQGEGISTLHSMFKHTM